MQAIANEPTDREIDLGFSYQPAVMTIPSKSPASTSRAAIS